MIEKEGFATWGDNLNVFLQQCTITACQVSRNVRRGYGHCQPCLVRFKPTTHLTNTGLMNLDSEAHISLNHDRICKIPDMDLVYIWFRYASRLLVSVLRDFHGDTLSSEGAALLFLGEEREVLLLGFSSCACLVVASGLKALSMT